MGAGKRTFQETRFFGIAGSVADLEFLLGPVINLTIAALGFAS
jgi:hypothetical protein